MCVSLKVKKFSVITPCSRVYFGWPILHVYINVCDLPSDNNMTRHLATSLLRFQKSKMFTWCSGYHVCLTHTQSPVQFDFRIEYLSYWKDGKTVLCEYHLLLQQTASWQNEIDSSKPTTSSATEWETPGVWLSHWRRCRNAARIDWRIISTQVSNW